MNLTSLRGLIVVIPFVLLGTTSIARAQSSSAPERPWNVEFGMARSRPPGW